ncbi:sulfatase [Lutibacter citreus]|uniref:sulfatase n=1 Tax=Lutibacter citreus TaxID=2138210 RepID=UPI000DBE000C|nr:sulfatase-like hydrolase/transferase [Lutibacter citreus]
MNLKKVNLIKYNKVFRLLFFLFVFLCSFDSVNADGTSKKNTSLNYSESYLVLTDSINLNELITNEIVYNAPKSEIVNFCWFSEDFSNEKVIKLNKSAKVFKNFVYAPMLKNNIGQFKISITMPKDSKIYYGFWITKNTSGVYQDLWDWRKEKVTLNNQEQLTFQVVYSQNEKSKKSRVVPYGWLIFLILSLFLLILYSLKGLWFKNLEKTSMIKKVVFLGVALFLFHVLARSEIIRLNPKSLFYDWGNVIKLFKASFKDLIYVLILISTVISTLFFIKKNKLRNIVLWIFKVIVFISAFVAFTNITTVILLGHPFNYEWFYYSDFLGSEDSINAIKENLTLLTIINLVAISTSVFLLEKIWEFIDAFINANKYIKHPSYLLVFLSIVFLVTASFRLDKKYDKGKVENAVLAMGASIINNDKVTSFFTLPLDDNERFKPREGTSLKVKNYSKEKAIKNVIFIILESSGAKYFDAYDGKYNITPNLNAYANKAILYKNAYAHAPATMKSMISLFGGIYPYVSYKCLTNEKPDFNHITLPSLLKEHDYKTSFFTSADLSYLKGDQFLKNHQFDTIEDFSDINCDNNYRQEMYKEGNAIDDFCLTQRFKVWLENNSKDNFFSTIWTVQGHYPYFFSQEEEDFNVNNIYFNRYLNTIKHCDQMIGDIIEVLKENKLFESTLIVVTGDHGEAFNQHNNHGHASTIYEENIKIPLYFINPLLFNGEQREDIVSMKDIAATTLKLLDIEVPPTWHGRDIISTHHDEVFFFTPYSDYLFGYRKENKKFIFNETTKTVEVFDLLNDPDEKFNIANEITELEINSAKKRIASWVQYQDKFVNENLLN